MELPCLYKHGVEWKWGIVCDHIGDDVCVLPIMVEQKRAEQIKLSVNDVIMPKGDSFKISQSLTRARVIKTIKEETLDEYGEILKLTLNEAVIVTDLCPDPSSWPGWCEVKLGDRKGYYPITFLCFDENF